MVWWTHLLMDSETSTIIEQFECLCYGGWPASLVTPMGQELCSASTYWTGGGLYSFSASKILQYDSTTTLYSLKCLYCTFIISTYRVFFIESGKVICYKILKISLFYVVFVIKIEVTMGHLISDHFKMHFWIIDAHINLQKLHLWFTERQLKSFFWPCLTINLKVNPNFETDMNYKGNIYDILNKFSQYLMNNLIFHKDCMVKKHHLSWFSVN